MAGLTSTGFVKSTLAEIKDRIGADLQSRLGASLNILPNSVNGHNIGVSSNEYDLLWQGLLDFYTNLDPNVASGTMLGNLCALTGIYRLAPTKSTTVLTIVTSLVGISLPAGRLVSDPATGVQFSTTVDLTTGATGTYFVAAEAVVAGSQAALSGTITQIDTPVSGWVSATNAEDAVVGTDLEADAALRIRRTASLQVQGSSPRDAIRADLLGVTGVTEAIVLMNVTDVLDANGLTPHSVEAVVLGGTDQAVADALLAGVAGGIKTGGSSSATSTDSEGNSHTMSFSRPTGVDVYVDVSVTTGAGYGGDAAVETAIAAYDGTLTIGDDLYASALYELVFDVAGVVDITALTVGIAPSPVGSSVIAGTRDKLDLDTTRVTVTS